MRLISRTIFREIFVTAIMGVVPFIFVLFMRNSRPLFEFLNQRSTVSIGEFCSYFADTYEQDTLRMFLADTEKHGMIVIRNAVEARADARASAAD